MLSVSYCMLSLSLAPLLPDTLRNVSFCMLWQRISAGRPSRVSVAADGDQPYLMLINLTKGYYALAKLGALYPLSVM